MSRQTKTSVAFIMLFGMIATVLVEQHHRREAREAAIKDVQKIARSGGNQDGPIPKNLKDLIDRDVDLVFVVLGVEKAKGFPGISKQDAERILAEARKDSAAALKNLQEVVYNNLSKEIKRYGYEDPAKEHRQNWNNNNGSTALLLIHVPLAERMGKKKELAQETIGERLGFDGWIKDIPGHRDDHWRQGIWPWPNETPPWFWANAKK